MYISLWIVAPFANLAFSPNNTYNVLINGESDKTGSLLEDFEPAVNPPKEIDDPEDKKPGDWVDEAKIADPEAKKVGFSDSTAYLTISYIFILAR